MKRNKLVNNRFCRIYRIKHRIIGYKKSLLYGINYHKPNNPEVEKFVQQLKNGTYDYYEKGENGEDLWLLIPNFS